MSGFLNNIYQQTYPLWWQTFPWSIESAQLPHDDSEAKNITLFSKRFVSNKFRSHPFRGAC
ncbi:hypothetical protein Hanom_Chr07g00613671 [Helianthus anomalus]